MEIGGNLKLRILSEKNQSWVGYIEDPRDRYDESGALYYVVAVVMIYGLSIVMMIASHIRKNKQDSHLRIYLKEMAVLRKNDRREKIMEQVNSMATNSFKIKTESKNNSTKTQPSAPTKDVKNPLLSTGSDQNDSVFIYVDACSTGTNFTPTPSPQFEPKQYIKVQTVVTPPPGYDQNQVKITITNEDDPL
ncbi:hypothetical protein SNE40_011751 [Patella caerulea]